MDKLNGTRIKGTLVYDGECGFCSASARLLIRHLPSRARIVPYQRIDLSALGLSRAEAEAAVCWVGHDGSRGAGPVAIGHLLRVVGSYWRPVGWLLRHPPVRWVAWPIYHAVSRIRHHLPGGTPACAIKLDNP